MRMLPIRIALLALLMVSSSSRADETKVATSDVPRAGLDAVKAMFADAQIVGAARETEDGKTFYEVTLKQAGRNIDVTVGVDGKIQLVEKEIPEKDLPKAVAAVLAAKFPGAKLKIIEEVSAMKAGKLVLDFYEALAVTGDKRVEVQIAPDGKIKHEEVKANDDE